MVVWFTYSPFPLRKHLGAVLLAPLVGPGKGSQYKDGVPTLFIVRTARIDTSY